MNCWSIETVPVANLETAAELYGACKYYEYEYLGEIVPTFDAETIERWEALTDDERRAVCAFIETRHADTLIEAIEALENGRVVALTSIETDDPEDYFELGWFLAEEYGILENAHELVKQYFNYEAYGRDAVFNGYYTWASNMECWVEYRG